MNLFQWFKPTPLYHVSVFMKSGNVIELYDIADFEFTVDGNKVGEFSLTRGDEKWLTRLLVKTIDLSQIEAITARRTR